jgi:ABC-type bacteriocin/lantibiotic exporter with double-glycine peptidase domain
MLPAFQQIYLAISQIRYSSIIVDYMQSTFKSIDEFIPIGKNSRKKIDFKTSIKLIDVNFKYKGSKNLIINALNLTIPSKSKIGIIGPTGGGKTTLVDLIIGLLEPDSGEIYIDNVKLDNQTKYSWHKKIGYVAQDIFLTDNDIWQNVAFGIEKKKIDRKKVQEVCKIACLDEFINSNLDLKYDTIVGDRGIKLSGGQKQRIGIARSLYLSPSILVLDEGTSSLDLDTEANIISNLIKMRNNITVLMVAHRLNTLKQCDLIIEIKNGKILSRGRYEDIIKKKIKTK